MDHVTQKGRQRDYREQLIQVFFQDKLKCSEWVHSFLNSITRNCK